MRHDHGRLDSRSAHQHQCDNGMQRIEGMTITAAINVRVQDSPPPVPARPRNADLQRYLPRLTLMQLVRRLHWPLYDAFRFGQFVFSRGLAHGDSARH